MRGCDIEICIKYPRGPNANDGHCYIYIYIYIAAAIGTGYRSVALAHVFMCAYCTDF